MIGEDKGAYKTPFQYAIKYFAAKDPLKMSESSGATFDPKQSIIRIKSLGQVIDIKYPEGNSFQRLKVYACLELEMAYSPLSFPSR